MDQEPLVGVYARIEDAGVLADAGRYEGALLMLLIAVAATSRKRYPLGTKSRNNPSKDMGDGEAFKTFLHDEMWRLVKEHDDTVQVRGQKVPIEDFLYKFLRCELVHEGKLPVDLHPMREQDVLTIDFDDGTGISFTPLFLTRLNDVIWRARENSYSAVKAEMDALAERQSNHPLK